MKTVHILSDKFTGQSLRAFSDRVKAISHAISLMTDKARPWSDFFVIEQMEVE